ncbi:SGNH/GDSL hydrolase family protein [candidate division KSB1 bacterium]|nr:SGNH/GDSL hydrolase family protein [candidate division KSB1 bacterium]
MLKKLKISIILSTVIVSFSLFLSCNDAKIADPPISEIESIFLALGDSYTIGQSVAVDERWPNQLAEQLTEQSVNIAQPTIIARTGWTTGQLLTAIQSSALSPPYDLVTLLIGVNDQYQGAGINYYRDGFSKLLAKAIELAGNNPQRVIVISIPDYSVTPFAQFQDTTAIRQELDLFNNLNRELSDLNNVHYVNITSISRKAKQDLSYLAPDKLHPSGKMYAEWVDQILPTVLNILK